MLHNLVGLLAMTCMWLAILEPGHPWTQSILPRIGSRATSEALPLLLERPAGA